MVFYSSTKFPTTLLKFRIACSTGEEGGGSCYCAKVELNCCYAPWEHIQGVLASMIGSDDSSNWGYRCCHTEHLYVAYFDLRHGHALASSPSLKEP